MTVALSFKGTGISNVEYINALKEKRVTVLGRFEGEQATGKLTLSNGQVMTVDLQTSLMTNGKTLASAWASRRMITSDDSDVVKKTRGKVLDSHP